jgi:TPR repeat protein
MIGAVAVKGPGVDSKRQNEYDLRMWLRRRKRTHISAEATTLNERASAGDIEAMVALGEEAEQAGDLERAYDWYSKAHERGHRGAKKMHSRVANAMHRKSRGSSQSELERSFRDGDATAACALGELLMNDGNLEEAVLVWRAGADAGDVASMNWLAECAFIDGQTGDGREWLGRAADCGDYRAMNRLGEISFEAGDTELARTWWQRAAGVSNDWICAAIGQTIISLETVAGRNLSAPTGSVMVFDSALLGDVMSALTNDHPNEPGQLVEVQGKHGPICVLAFAGVHDRDLPVYEVHHGGEHCGWLVSLVGSQMPDILWRESSLDVGAVGSFLVESGTFCVLDADVPAVLRDGSDAEVVSLVNKLLRFDGGGFDGYHAVWSIRQDTHPVALLIGWSDLFPASI